MKTDDYVAIYRAEPNQTEALSKVCAAFIDETNDLIKTRHIQGCHSAYLAICKEQSDKWKAFVRRINGEIKEDGYSIIIRKEYSMFVPYI